MFLSLPAILNQRRQVRCLRQSSRVRTRPCLHLRRQRLVLCLRSNRYRNRLRSSEYTTPQTGPNSAKFFGSTRLVVVLGSCGTHGHERSRLHVSRRLVKRIRRAVPLVLTADLRRRSVRNGATDNGLSPIHGDPYLGLDCRLRMVEGSLELSRRHRVLVVRLTMKMPTRRARLSTQSKRPEWLPGWISAFATRRVARSLSLRIPMESRSLRPQIESPSHTALTRLRTLTRATISPPAKANLFSSWKFWKLEMMQVRSIPARPPNGPSFAWRHALHRCSRFPRASPRSALMT